VQALVSVEHKSLLGSKLVLDKADEPGNIIWENLDSTMRERRCRMCWVFTLMSLFIVGMFIGFSFLKQSSVEFLKKYPPQKCAQTNAMYENVGDSGITYKNMAQIDKDYTQSQVGTGAYQCFCEALFNKSAVSIIKVPKGCNAYVSDKRTNILVTNSLTIGITVINFVIRGINIWLAGCIRLHTISK